MLQLAGQITASRLEDGLAAITPGAGSDWVATVPDPGSGATLTLSDLNIPADTLLVFAGGRDFGGTVVSEGGYGGWGGTGSSDWLGLVAARGKAGALASPPTAFGPWGGSVSFNTTATWFFNPSPGSAKIAPLTD